jgi:hypothetical protein
VVEEEDLSQGSLPLLAAIIPRAAVFARLDPVDRLVDDPVRGIASGPSACIERV